MDCLPVKNSERFRHFELSEYASDTRWGLREFQPSSASRTFSMADSRLKGGRGGLLDIYHHLLADLSGSLWISSHAFYRAPDRQIFQIVLVPVEQVHNDIGCHSRFLGKRRLYPYASVIRYMDRYIKQICAFRTQRSRTPDCNSEFDKFILRCQQLAKTRCA